MKVSGCLLSLASFALAATCLAQQPALQADWIQSPINGNWYGVDYTVGTWVSGQSSAQTLGGNLATIRDQAEQDWCLTQFQPYLASGANWIGLFQDLGDPNYSEPSGAWKWSSGEPLVYGDPTQSNNAWNPGEPNNAGSEHVAAMTVVGWNDGDGNNGIHRPLIELPAKPRLGWSWPRMMNSVYGSQWGCLADLDGDQDIDYAVPSHGDAFGSGTTLGVFLNDGTGQFFAGPVIPLGESGPTDVEAIDHDQDGDLDLVVTLDTSLKLLLVENEGNLTFTTDSSPLVSGGDYHSVIAMHADNDGILDLVVSAPNMTAIQVGFGRLGGGFAFSGSMATGDARFLNQGDLNGDGFADLIVSGAVDDVVRILISDGTGSFTKSSELAAVGPRGVSVGDLDGDLDLDLCVPDNKSVQIWTNDGIGNFKRLGPPWTLGGFDYTSATGDFDGDGDLDIVGSGRVLANDGLGGFSLSTTIANSGKDVLVADLDGEGSLDVVCSSPGGFTVSLNQVFPDCNGTGTPDNQDIANGTSSDCNGNGVPDECDLADSSFDCDGNGYIDSCEIAGDPSLDCDGNGSLDICDLLGDPTIDCDGNLLIDSCEIFADPNLDCDGNGILDYCDIFGDPALDCDFDGALDLCQISSDPSLDCDGNAILDSCEIASDPSLDCDLDGVLDSCQIFSDPSMDCDGNNVLDSCQIAGDPSLDQDGDGVLDSCQCAFSNFCISTKNSTGLPATIGYSGSASISAEDLTLTAIDLPTFQFGIFFYGADEWFKIMGDGVLCIAPQLYRIKTVVTTGTTGTASLTLDYNSQPLASGAGQVVAFSTWRFQLWYRDPTGGPAGSNTTNGLMVTFCP